MGSDDLFNKRKAKQTKELKRHQAKRAPYDRVLILCEGTKTEPNYFQELCDYYRLNSANVKISGDCGSAPISVVQRAKELFLVEQRKGIPFDRVYCVFDKDSHDSYEAALQEVKIAKPKTTFFAINSVPCFEYWLLLHFAFSTQPFCGTAGAKNAGDQVLEELKKYVPDYAKGNGGYFESLISQLPQAIVYSKQSQEAADASGTDNPSTLVHELVEYLQELGKTSV